MYRVYWVKRKWLHISFSNNENSVILLSVMFYKMNIFFLPFQKKRDCNGITVPPHRPEEPDYASKDTDKEVSIWKVRSL